MNGVIVTGYTDRNDGPSVVIKELSKTLSSTYEVTNIESALSFFQFVKVLHSKAIIFNSCNTMPLLISFLIFFMKRKVVISIMHGNPEHYENFKLKNFLIKYTQSVMLEKSDHIVFVSTVQKNNFIHDRKINVNCKLHVVPNIVNLIDAKIDASQKVKKIIYVGGESPSKGRLLLDEIIILISQNSLFSGYTLEAYGMNSDSVQKVGCISVNFSKKIEHTSILDVYRTSEIFLSLSPEETFGVACVEALLLSNKVICSSMCGFTEFVPCDNVFIYDDSSIEKIYVALVECVKSNFVDDGNFNSNLSAELVLAEYVKMIGQ